MNIPTRILDNTRSLLGDYEKPHIILGLSGGPDSVYLFHVLLALQKSCELTFSAAHLDHGWQESSGSDAIFCQNLCEKHGIHYIIRHASQIKINERKYKGSKEHLGRALRRAFFEQVLQEENGNFIALAHHAQDQEETFFLRMIRGTTLSGLCGMRPKSGPYIRPLLHLSKQDILTLLDEHEISYLEDPTNKSYEFLRNRIRHQVLPALHAIDERFSKTFISMLGQLQEEDAFLEQLTVQAFNEVFFEQDGKLVGSLPRLRELHPVLRRRALMYWLKKEGVPFTPTRRYFAEIERFLLPVRGGSHRLGISLVLQKRKNLFWADAI